MRRLLPILSLLLISCQNVLSISPTPSPPTPEQTPASAETIHLEYAVVHREGDFEIREAVIGEASANPYRLPVPAARIRPLAPDLSVQQADLPQPDPEGMRFALKLTLPADPLPANIFVLASENLPHGNGRVLLQKNDQVIWRGQINGGLNPPIEFLDNLHGELVLGYHHVIAPGVGVQDFVLWSEGETVQVVESAFAPHVLQGELFYFLQRESRILLVRSGREIDTGYTDVFRPCCGYAFKYGIVSDGRTLDFFATRDGLRYHVQAGFR